MGLLERTSLASYSSFGYNSSFGISNNSYYSFGSYGYTKPVLFNFGGYNKTYTPTYSFRLPSISTNYKFTDSYSDYSSFAPPSDAFSSTSVSSRKLGSLTASNKRQVTSYSGKTSEYAGLSRNIALSKARQDSRLEYIGDGGYGWSISSGSFRNDITFASRGTSKLLDDVVREIRRKDPNFTLLVTSALGTANSPHAKKAGHYNTDNVKLDFGGGMSKAQASKVAAQLKSTGKFAFANIECDGQTWHIDAQFKKELLA